MKQEFLDKIDTGEMSIEDVEMAQKTTKGATDEQKKKKKYKPYIATDKVNLDNPILGIRKENGRVYLDIDKFKFSSKETFNRETY